MMKSGTLNMNTKKILTNNYVFWTALLSVAVWLRWFHLGKRSIWLDEAYSLKLASFSFADIIAGAAMDIHPPLFHILLSWWVKLLGTSEVALRSLPALFGVLLIPLAYQLAKDWATPQPARLTAWLLACSPYFIEISRMGRMPALLAFFSVGSLFYFWKSIQRYRLTDAIGFLGFMLAALYTHYFAILLLLGFHIYIFVGIGKLNLTRDIRKRWFAMQLVLLAGYAPWLTTIWQHFVKGGPGWRGIGSSWSEPFHVIYHLILGTANWQWWHKLTAIGSLLLAVSLIVIIFKPKLLDIYHRLKPGIWGLLATCFVVMMGAVWLYSMKKMNVFDYRYLSIVAFIMLFIVGMVIMSLGRTGRLVIMGLLGCSFMMPVYNQLFNQQYYDDWRSLAARIKRHDHSVVAIYPPWNENPLNYYLKDKIKLMGLPGDYHPITGKTQPFFYINDQNEKEVEARLSGQQDVLLLLVNEGPEQRWLRQWFEKNYQVIQNEQIGGLYLFHGTKVYGTISERKY